jgi:hypothetical protein
MLHRQIPHFINASFAEKRKEIFFDNPRENFFLISKLNFVFCHYIDEAELMEFVGYLFGALLELM